MEKWSIVEQIHAKSGWKPRRKTAKTHTYSMELEKPVSLEGWGCLISRCKGRLSGGQALGLCSPAWGGGLCHDTPNSASPSVEGDGGVDTSALFLQTGALILSAGKGGGTVP